jgi:hypothetical protein
MYKGRRSQRLGQAGLLKARPTWVASSQVDPPQVSQFCDSVALRTEHLGTQALQASTPHNAFVGNGLTLGALSMNL